MATTPKDPKTPTTPRPTVPDQREPLKAPAQGDEHRDPRPDAPRRRNDI